MRRTLIALLPLVVASSVTVGCQGFPLPGGTGPNYGSLAFGPASDANKAMLSQSGSATREGAPTPAPAAAPMMADSGTSMVAPMPHMSHPVGYWPGGDYELEATSEAKAAGFTGTLAEALDKHVRPVVRDWAADASLRAAGGLANDKGVNPAATTDGPKPYGDGWRFSFFSPAKLETLSFLVSTDQTLVLKQTFKSRALDIQGPQIGSAEVIAIVSKAIKDPNATAFDPEQYGGSGASTGVGIARPAIAVDAAPPPPTVAVGEPAPDRPTDGGSAPSYQPPKEDLIYEVPADARWDLNLFPEGKRLIWNVNLTMQMDPSTAVSSDSQRIGYGGGWARVDANTGALLSLERPRKITFFGGGVPEPMPLPAAQAEPASKPTP